MDGGLSSTTHHRRGIMKLGVALLIGFAFVTISVLWLLGVTHTMASSETLPQESQTAAIPSQVPICGTPTVVGGTISSDATWSTFGLYVLDSDVTVNAGVTLTIQPGVVIKAKPHTKLLVNGKLVADGTVANPIYLTSWKDDTVCGDTNGDGWASTPAAGDWGWIQFNSGSDPTGILRRAVVRHGGYCSYYNCGGGEWRGQFA